MITAMKKRYQVFVSSTFVDLHEERNEVMQALLELNCIPAGMELFPAANDDQWTLIKKAICALSSCGFRRGFHGLYADCDLFGLKGGSLLCDTSG
jgi:uncharacterized protein DUF4062